MQHNASICLSLLGQLVQHCNGTPEGGGSTSIQAWIFFRHYFPYWLSCGHYSKSLLHSLLCSATSILIIWLWGLQSIVLTCAQWYLSLTPMSDQDRISPHLINTISSRQVMRIKKKYQLVHHLHLSSMCNA